MKGIAAGKPGEVIIFDFPTPELSDGDLIVKPLACGICSTDVKMAKRGAGGKVEYALGHELAAEIIEISAGEKRWKVGQKVVAAPYLPCGDCYYCQRGQPTLCKNLFSVFLSPGGLAERVKIPRDLADRGTFLIPKGMPVDIAALAEPFGCVIKGLDDVGLKAGDSILIIGDGPMGVISAAVSRYYDASLVMVAGMTPHRLAVLDEHYADVVINVSHSDLRSEVDKHTHGRGADIVISAVSSAEALSSAIACVRPGGWVNAFAGVPDGITIALDIKKLHYQQYFLTGSFGVGPNHLAKALELFASGRVNVAPVISAHFPFEQAIEAIAYARDRVGLKAMVTF
ncbi:MAG: alcohol dehydrogenase catalytic domain-containing protein [Chloroflexota bacterium]|nr:alcohol dehydrogenase catalytic domain-containing protein [Chloroflexota bacterium]